MTIVKRYFSVVMLILASAASTLAQTVTTIAGNGATGFLSGAYGGDGVAATAALLYYPSGLAYDATGNLYIADSRNHRVRKIDVSGIITTFAGTGVSGYSGDGGAATAAEMGYPESIAIDATGNIYVSDHWEACVRKIDAAGIITTVAGTGVYGYSGDGGPATAAMLDNPCHVQVDGAGNLYICDWVNARVRKVSTAGIITTIAGNGTAPFSGDGGPATAAGMRPSSTLIDATGNILVCDGVNRRVRKIDAAGIITTIAGSGGDGYSGDGGPATAAQFRYMVGMVFDATGNLLVADQNNSVIRKINTSGIITTIAGTGTSGYSGDGGPATAAEFRYPTMMLFNPAGQLLISDLQNNRVRMLDVAGPVATVVREVNLHEGIAISPNPNQGNLSIVGYWPSTNNSVISVSITNVTGQIVYMGKLFVQNGEIGSVIHLNDKLVAGVYVLKLSNGADAKTFHIVLEK